MTTKMKAKWGSLDELLTAGVAELRRLGPEQAVRIDPKLASARSVSAKVSVLRKQNRPEFGDVRVTVKKGAAYLYLGSEAQVEVPKGPDAILASPEGNSEGCICDKGDACPGQ